MGMEGTSRMAGMHAVGGCCGLVFVHNRRGRGLRRIHRTAHDACPLPSGRQPGMDPDQLSSNLRMLVEGRRDPETMVGENEKAAEETRANGRGKRS